MHAHAPVAQLDRVQPSEGWGRTFDSCLARQPPPMLLIHQINRTVKTALVELAMHVLCLPALQVFPDLN